MDIALNLNTVRPLTGIHTGTARLLITEANSLLFSGFGFEPGITVGGIQVLLNTQRLARIQDRTVQLYYQQLVGSNRADLAAENLHQYGSSEDLWDLTQALPWHDPEFGVVVDLRPHISIPSNNTAFIFAVSMRLNIVSV